MTKSRDFNNTAIAFKAPVNADIECLKLAAILDAHAKDNYDVTQNLRGFGYGQLEQPDEEKLRSSVRGPKIYYFNHKKFDSQAATGKRRQMSKYRS